MTVIYFEKGKMLGKSALLTGHRTFWLAVTFIFEATASSSANLHNFRLQVAVAAAAFKGDAIRIRHINPS
jgi:hypothetical protein